MGINHNEKNANSPDMFPNTAKNQGQMLLSTPIKYTFWLYNPRFWHKNIPFGVLTHVETLVCLTRK